MKTSFVSVEDLFAGDRVCRGICLGVNVRNLNFGLSSTNYPNTNPGKSTLEQSLETTVVSEIESKWEIQ